MTTLKIRKEVCPKLAAPFSNYRDHKNIKNKKRNMTMTDNKIINKKNTLKELNGNIKIEKKVKN